MRKRKRQIVYCNDKREETKRSWEKLADDCSRCGSKGIKTEMRVVMMEAH